jgi:hypothetical protein
MQIDRMIFNGSYSGNNGWKPCSLLTLLTACTQIIFIAKICAHMRQIMCTQLGGLIDLSPFK